MIKLILSALFLILPSNIAAKPILSPLVQAIDTAAIPRRLSIVETGGTKRSGQIALYDFGQHRLFDHTKIEHVFQLKNETSEPIILDHLQPTCGCTSVSIVGENGIASKLIAPGQTISIQASLDPALTAPGLEEKFVYVFIAGQAEPAATLEMKGTLLSGVTYSKNVLDVGQIKPGDNASESLKATLDPNVIIDGKAPHLVSTNPDVILTQLSTTLDKAGTVTQVYAAKISPKAHLGVLSGSLYWAGPDNTELASLRNASVPIQGQVIGSIASNPLQVSFGTVKTGNSVEESIIVTATSPDTLAKVTVVSGSPQVLKALFVRPAPGQTIAVLKLSLDSSLPAGILSTQITLTTPQGEQLVIPVYAYAIMPQTKK